MKEIETSLDVEESELLKLAVCLNRNADGQDLLDAAIDQIDTDYEPDDDEIEEFENNKQNYGELCDVMSLLGKLAYVSKKITEEGWKVGYMFREDPEDDEDSGWRFFAGDEDDDYTRDANNVTFTPVGAILELDPALMSFIVSEPGMEFVRVSADEFEKYDDQDPYMEKWKQ